MVTHIFEAKPFMSIRETVEKALAIARGINSDVIIVFNDTRFSVKPDTTIQQAIDTYLAVKSKIAKTQQTLNQNTK